MIKHIILIQLLFLLVGCASDDSNPINNNIIVSIETSGLNDGKLTLRNLADFTATISGFKGDLSSLNYRWTLSTENGAFKEGLCLLSNPLISGSSITCIGKMKGDEEIMVEVLDASNSILAVTSYNFTIIPADDPGSSLVCFDQPKFIYGGGPVIKVCNYDGSNQKNIGIYRGGSADISPNGEWVAWNFLSEDTPNGKELFIRRCGMAETDLSNDFDQDYFPHFSPDSMILYFLRPDPNSKPLNPNIPTPSRPIEIVALDMATGELDYLTSVYQNEETISSFAVNPITGNIAFYRQGEDNATTLSIINTCSGMIEDFTTLPPGIYDNMSFSPDGTHIIFSDNAGAGIGIFKLELTDGSQPSLLFPNPFPGFISVKSPHYYDNGNRIVYCGSDGNQTPYRYLWTIDANGNDRQILDIYDGNLQLHGVLH